MEFDEEKLNNLNTDFSLFHPAVEQLNAMYYFASLLSSKIGLDEGTVRNLIIRTTVRYQKQISKFHYEHRQVFPQARVVVTREIGELIKQELINLLADCNEDTIQEINEIITDSFEEYMENRRYE